VSFDDDGPSFLAEGAGTAVVHDETGGIQDTAGPGDDDGNDVLGSALPTAIRNAFNALGPTIDDPHVGEDPASTNNAIGYAAGVGSILSVTPNFGADGPAAGGGSAYALVVNNAASGLFTTEGGAISLFQDSPTMVTGRYDGPDVDTTIDSDDPIAFAIQIDPATGQIYVAQWTSLDHPLEANPGNSFTSYDEFVALAADSLHASVTITDGDGDTATTEVDISANVRFEDDGPTAVNNVRSVEEGALQTVDIQWIVDVSGSMNDDFINVPGTDLSNDRIGLARFAMREAIENNPQIQNVQFIKFSDSVSSTVWLSRDDALAYINNNANWGVGGSTNYDIALQEAINAYGNSARPLGVSDDTVVAFLSDGLPNEPSGDPGITTDGTGSNVSIAEWELHITTANPAISNVFAVGIGPGVSATVLEPIAYPNTDANPADGVEDNVVLLANDSDVAAFVAAIDDLIAPAASIGGNVLQDDPFPAVTGADSFGADGGRILSIEVDGTLYTWNGTNLVTPSGDPVPVGAVIGTDSITVPTVLGGTITFDFATGDWEYVAPDDVTGPAPAEVFTYTLIDGDNDQNQATLTINVTPVNDAPEISLNTAVAAFNVRDEFENVAYSNNNGNANWAGNWVEESDDNLANNGDIRIVTDLGDGALRFGNGSDAAIVRVVDLSQATSATLSFDYRQLNISSTSEDVRVFISSNGSDFTKLLEIDSGTSSTYQSFGPLDISAFMSATTTIRIEVEGDLDDGEFAFIDNINIAYTAPVLPTFTEGGAAVNIMPLATVADPDSPANFNLGFLTVAITTGLVAGDALLFAGGGATESSGDVFVGVVQIGTVAGYGTSSMTITFDTDATDARVEALMQAIAFQNSTSDNPGTSRTIAVTFDDGGNTGIGGPLSDTVNVQITVVPANDAPVNAFPGAQSVDEDTNLVFSGGNAISISDVDVGAGTETVTLSVINGVLTLSGTTGLSFAVGDGAADTTLTFTGSVANINAALNGLIYRGNNNFNGSDTLTITTNDNGNTGAGGAMTDTDTVAITVNAVDDAPIIKAPALLYLAEVATGNVSPINRISFQDADSPGIVRVTLAMDNGSDVLSATTGGGVTVGGSGTSSITLDGTIASINAFLYAGNVQWDPSGSADGEAGVLTVTIDDNGITPLGNVVSVPVNISELVPDTVGTIVNNYSGVNIVGDADYTPPSGSGNNGDTITTSWSNTTSTRVLYDGGSGTGDTVTLVFTPDQLAEILADPTARAALTTYLADSTPTGLTLDLSATSWNATVQGFENVSVSLATGYGDGSVALANSHLIPVPTFDTTPDADTNDDLVVGDNNANILTGGAGAGGLNGDDVLVGLGGNDTLSGGSGADLLLGGDGDDSLTGGTGNDVLSGGRGADTFIFLAGDNTAGNADTIVDYSFVEGDKLDLSGLLDANFGPSSTVSDFVRLQQSGSNVLVQVDTNGTAGGVSFVTVATLANYATAGDDLVKVFFESADQTLTV